MPFFGTNLPVIRRRAVPSVNGRAGKPIEEEGRMVLGWQPATSGDYDRAVAISGGRRLSQVRRAYGDLGPRQLVPAGARGAPGQRHAPGDLVVNEGERWLVIGLQPRTSLPGMPTQGVRYLLVAEAEHEPGEVLA